MTARKFFALATLAAVLLLSACATHGANGKGKRLNLEVSAPSDFEYEVGAQGVEITKSTSGPAFRCVFQTRSRISL